MLFFITKLWANNIFDFGATKAPNNLYDDINSVDTIVEKVRKDDMEA